MRMRLLVALFCIASLPAWGQRQEPSSGKPDASPEASTASVTNQGKQPASPENDRDDGSHHWPPPWWSPFWPNWLFVIVGSCAAVAAVKTLVATQKAAEAAATNAKAIVNAERAWILAEIDFSPGSGRVVHTAIPSEDGQRLGTTAAIRLTCRNHGGTPGWITEIKGRIETTARLPDAPNLQDADVIFHGCMPLGVDQPFQKDHALTVWQAGAGSGNPFEQRTFVYGVVAYMDAVTGERRETYWGYVVLDSRRIERLGDHSAYNRST